TGRVAFVPSWPATGFLAREPLFPPSPRGGSEDPSGFSGAGVPYGRQKSKRDVYERNRHPNPATRSGLLLADRDRAPGRGRRRRLQPDRASHPTGVAVPISGSSSHVIVLTPPLVTDAGN